MGGTKADTSERTAEIWKPWTVCPDPADPCGTAPYHAGRDCGYLDGSLRFVPVTAFIAFIWQGGSRCDGGVPYLSGHFGPVLSGACSVYNSAAALFRSMGKTKAIMNISIAMNAINVIGNAIGIFALHARMAVPSLASRTFAAVAMLVLCFQKKNTLYVELGKALAWNGKMLKRILNIAVPNGVENGLFQLSKVALFNGLRAAGDIKFTMYASIFATVVCRVIFSIVLGVWMDLGVIGICLAMVGDWLVKAALILVRYRSRKWTKFQVIN